MRGILKFIIAILVGAVSLVSYWCNTQENEFTGEKQHVDMTVEQEIALGLQAAPQMADQYGGLHPDTEAAQAVKDIGHRLIQSSELAIHHTNLISICWLTRKQSMPLPCQEDRFLLPADC